MHRHFRRIAAIPALALIIGLGAASSSTAATCPSGAMCLFGDLSYTTASGYFQSTASYGSLSGHPMNNKATSIAANGGRCQATHFYDAANRGGSFLRLNSETLIGSGYRDPDLRNGAGDSIYRGWNYDDRISAWAFTFCYN